MTGQTPPLLSRDAVSASSTPPVRIVHIGLGAFHRSHQAWYTARSADAADWGIAAFTGRSAQMATLLDAQDGLYTLVKRGPDTDTFQVVDSIVRAVPGADIGTFLDLLGSHEVVILTLTITEHGYRFDRDGGLDLRDPVVAEDIELLRAAFASVPSTWDGVAPRTVLGRIVLGLERRRRTGAPTLAIVPCDNIPDNGRLVGEAIAALARATSSDLADWLPEGISVVSTSVDRITPRTTAADTRAVLAATGRTDRAPVVTEPFSDWVLSGRFPSGRPAWETAGARFVDDIAPWEARKLWMLNGAHTVLATLGTLRGHSVVSDAIRDPVCRDLVLALWEEDARHLGGVEVDVYATHLLARFGNPRIEHRLEQIAADSTTKVRLRIVPVARRERAAGRPADGCAAAIAAWVLACRAGVCGDPGISTSGPLRDLIGTLDPRLGADVDFRARVQTAIDAFGKQPLATKTH